MRDVRNAPRAHNLNLFLNLNSENQNNNFGGGAFGGNNSDLSQLFFKSPCKFFYSVDNSEWSKGIDINLMNPKKAPLNLVVSMPPEMDRSPEVLMSRAAYYTQWESVPKDAYFFKRKGQG